MNIRSRTAPNDANEFVISESYSKRRMFSIRLNAAMIIGSFLLHMQTCIAEQAFVYLFGALLPLSDRFDD